MFDGTSVYLFVPITEVAAGFANVMWKVFFLVVYKDIVEADS